jgi:hypothetical protein
MNNHRQLYEELAQLPPRELSQLLAEVLPYGEIQARMDGSVALVHAYGLRRFQSTADLLELGIPEEDPRSKVFTATMQNLVSENIQNALRSHAARTRTVCKDQGAIEVWEGPRKAWWVPVECFEGFNRAVSAHMEEFAELRDRFLVDPYEDLRWQAKQNYRESLQAAWEDLAASGQARPSLQEYLDSGLQFFEERFPTRDEIQRDIRMEMEVVSRTLPPVITHKVEKIRVAEAAEMTARTEALRAMASKESEQMKLVEIQKQAEMERLEILKEKRRKQDELLLAQMRPEISRMQEAMERISASTTQLADEIIRAARDSVEISPAVSKSWNTRLERLRKLAPSNPRLGEAVEALQQLKEDSVGEQRTNGYHIRQAQHRVEEGLAELAETTAFESFANDVFSLLQGGDKERVLSRIHRARSRHREQLDELENLYQYVVEIMARQGV